MSLKLQVIFNFLSKFTLQVNIFILSIILVRYLDKNTYGTYLQFQLCVNTGIYMFTLGIPHSVYYFYSKVNNKLRYILTSMAVMVCLGVLIAVTLNYGDFLGEWLNNDDLNKFAFLIGISIVALLPYELAEPFLISAKKSNYFSVLNAVSGMFFFLIVLFCLMLEKSLDVIFTSITTLYVVQFLVLLSMIVYFAKGGSDEKKDLRNVDVTFKQIVSYCLPISLQVMIGKMGGMLDRYIISVNFNPAEYAVYSRGATHLPIIEILPYSMSNILFPKYVAYHESAQIDKMFLLWRKAISKVALLIYPVFAFFGLYSGDFIVIVYTEQYLDSVPIFQVYLAMLLIKVAIMDTLMRVAGKTNFMPYIATISMVSNLVLGLVLLNYLGIIGPAIATIFVIFLNAFLCLFFTKRVYSVSWREMVPWWHLGKILFVSVVAILPFYIFKAERVGLIELGFSFGFYILMFVLLAIVFKLTTFSEIKIQYLQPVLNKLKKKGQDL